MKYVGQNSFRMMLILPSFSNNASFFEYLLNARLIKQLNLFWNYTYLSLCIPAFEQLACSHGKIASNWA